MERTKKKGKEGRKDSRTSRAFRFRKRPLLALIVAAIAAAGRIQKFFSADDLAVSEGFEFWGGKGIKIKQVS